MLIVGEFADPSKYNAEVLSRVAEHKKAARKCVLENLHSGMRYNAVGMSSS